MNLGAHEPAMILQSQSKLEVTTIETKHPQSIRIQKQKHVSTCSRQDDQRTARGSAVHGTWRIVALSSLQVIL
jgi:hypothetical protein